MYSEQKQALAETQALKRPAVLAVSGVHNSGKTTLLEKLLPAEKGTLQRGEIVHFQMKQYQQSSAMLGALVTLLATERTSYTVRSVLDIMNNTDFIYTYPLADEEIGQETIVRQKRG